MINCCKHRCREEARTRFQPTFSCQCDASGRSQRNDIYILLHSGLLDVGLPFQWMIISSTAACVRPLVGVMLCRGADNCGEMSAIRQRICLFRLKPTWSDETSLSSLIREFICFLFSHRLIAAVASNSCETSSVPHPPPSTLHLATARLLQQTHVCLLPSERSQLGLSRCAPLQKPLFLFLSRSPSSCVKRNAHTASPTLPPPCFSRFLFLPRSPPWLHSSLPGLTSTFVFILLLKVSFVSLFCVYNTHPVPVATPLPHQTWVQKAGKEGNWKVPPVLLPPHIQPRSFKHPTTNQPEAFALSAVLTSALSMHKSCSLLDLEKKKKS